MHLATCKNYCIGLVLLLAFPASAFAIPTITCHCFTQRSYDPAHPAKADPYFLATTQNSFFSTVFATRKVWVVLKKQAGASSDDLWVTYWIAKKAAVAPGAVLELRKGKRNWPEVFTALGLSDQRLGARFAASVKSNPSASGIARAVVDDLLLQYRLQSDQELVSLRRAGAANQELILASMLAAKTGQPAIKLYGEVKSGAKSWGDLLDRAKIAPKEIQKVLASILVPSG
jgi:hypothetical protein